MGFEKFGKILGNIASTTAKKAGEQVQIAKLGIDRAGLERQIEGVYAAIGRYCYSKVKAGETMPEELLDYCRDIDVLMQQIADLDLEIEQHKNERDAAEYSVATDIPEDNTAPVAEVIEVEVTETVEPVLPKEPSDKE
ncbi:MAG: hypothetical protein K0S22_1060 [Oscillospiraceae bacterium]|jgi:hypothetical protein|nr:hypothetical protein [Oscillospiraceae bacterium]